MEGLATAWDRLIHGRGYGLELVGMGMCLPPTVYNPQKGPVRLGVPWGLGATELCKQGPGVRVPSAIPYF